MNDPNPEIEVRPSLPCPMCGGELLFAARVPIPNIERGYRTATLCPTCHRDTPAAQGVLAFFAVHERITTDTLRDATGVIQQWIDHIIQNPPTYSTEDLDDDIRRWENGELN